jgi:hypothetical protein
MDGERWKMLILKIVRALEVEAAMNSKSEFLKEGFLELFK